MSNPVSSPMQTPVCVWRACAFVCGAATVLSVAQRLRVCVARAFVCGAARVCVCVAHAAPVVWRAGTWIHL
eukprot:11158222-Prorocentrum_lima.AAC.1